MEKDRKIYLVRHGAVYEEDGSHRCLGHVDVPLTKRGERQAGKMAEWFQDKHITGLYSSPQQRCVKTAQIIKEYGKNFEQGAEIRVLDALQELDAGKWENLSFERIREDYPEEYEARGKQLGYYAIPGGESFYEAGIRFGNCLDAIRRAEKGDILIVAHAGVMRGYLSGLLGISPNDVFTIPQPYAGVTVLREKGMSLEPERIGWRMPEFLDREEIQCLYHKCGTSGWTVQHMEMVAQYLERLEKSFKSSDYNWELLKTSARVHDICRTQRNHERAGANILRKEGYREVAKLVEGHHRSDCFAGTALSEEELLFYADKRVQEDRIVALEERFQASMWKCKTPEAKENHCRQYEKAKGIELKIEELFGGMNE